MKLLILLCIVAAVSCAEVFYTRGAYVAPIVRSVPVFPHSAAVHPLIYSRFVAPLSAAVESHHSIETPDSFQQTYRADYKPVAYEYIY